MSIRFFDVIQFDVHNLGMATDRHQAPSYPLRMPEELKARVQSAAAESGRSVHAELLHRIQSSFLDQPAIKDSDLTPTLVRMERDLAKLEVQWAWERLVVGAFAATLRPLLRDRDANEVLDGMLEGATVAEWREIANAYLQNRDIVKQGREAIDRLRRGEEAVLRLPPKEVDPVISKLTQLGKSVGLP